ncbi:hypothetical protein CC2G_014443 [Coprinopsis cinerea AmutBmut pab1-1]|nr:hypothetical protein CC2G_014443 [Coprinopsis cinerea AmutBmut pab1-1]
MESAWQLTKTFGATTIATYLSSMMYGLTVYQTYRYFRRYTGDKLTIKSLVGLLWIIDTLQTIFSIHFNYHYLVSHFNDPSEMVRSNWSFRLAVLLLSAPPLLSNLFYVSRLWIIGTRNLILLGTIMALVLTRFVFQMILAAKAWQHPIFTDYQPFLWMVRAYCGASLAADIILAFAFCWTLHKRRTGYKRTDSKIDLLMIYTINTGSLTSLLCLLSLMSILFMSGSFVYIGLHAILGKLYVNSVLAVLNSRRPKNRRDESLYELAAFESTGSRKSSRIIFRRGSISNGAIDIQGMIRIHQETTTTHDDTLHGTASSDRTLQLSQTDKIDIEKA